MSDEQLTKWIKQWGKIQDDMASQVAAQQQANQVPPPEGETSQVNPRTEEHKGE